MGKKLLLALPLILLLLLVVSIFWHQEVKFMLPTPVPQNYKAVALKETILLDSFGIPTGNKPVLLHFFNPDCPCSRFNTEHFISLVKEYSKSVSIYVVLQGSQDVAAVEQMLIEKGIALPVLADTEYRLAEKCGVYATPQAVLLKAGGSLFYRGNYNRSRYCTDQKTSYARIALAALTAGEEPPQFAELATTAYGCELTDKQSSLIYFLSL